MSSVSRPPAITFQIGSSHQTQMSFDLPTLREYITQWSEMTPWHKFMLFINAHKENSILSLPLPWGNENSEHLIQNHEISRTRYSHTVTASIPHYERSQAEDWLYELLIADVIVDGIEMLYIDPQCLTPNQYLPKTRNNDPDLDMNAVCSLSHQNNQLEFLKLAVKLLSDNAYVPELKSAIVELARDNRVLSALRRLLDQKLLSVEAFAEKLLMPAIGAGDKALVEMLINAGVSLDMEGGASKALWYAIELGHTELVEVLLNRGASATAGASPAGNYIRLFEGPIEFRCYDCESLLDVAVAFGNFDIVMAIMKSNPRGHATPPITLHTLFHAASLRCPDILLRILSIDPTAVELMKLNPYVVVNGAARGGNIEVFTELKRHGLDFDVTMPIKGKPDLGKATALAEASYRGHKELVEYLLSEGANVDGRVHDLYTPPPLFTALWYGHNQDQDWILHEREDIVRSFSYGGPNDNRDVLCLLLDNDADPNISWGGYNAIHIAAAPSGWDATNITTLQKAGADVNITDDRDDQQAIAFALQAGNTDIVHTLLRIGATLDPNDALKMAFIGRNRGLVDVVLEKLPRGSGNSYSLEACITSFGCDLARDLLEDFTFNRAEDLNSPEVVCAAVYDGDEEFVRMCCEIEGPPQDYLTSALAMAAQKQDVAMIQLLLEVGVKPYVPLRSCVHVPNALHNSTRYELSIGTDAMNELLTLPIRDKQEFWDVPDFERLMQATKLLINACKADFDHFDKEKARRSSLRRFFHDAIRIAPLAIVRMLVDSDFSIYKSCDSLQSLLQWALEERRSSIAVFLLEHGSNPNWEATVVGSRNPIHTALQYAVQQNLTSMTKSLLDKKMEVNAEPAKFRGATAFQYCAINSNFEIAFMLLEANADINASPALYNGRTAIEGAAEHGRLNMVKFLLVAGADIRGRNNKNYARTIYRAWANDHRTILKMIQEFKRDRFGPDDVESIKVIVKAMTQDELNFWDLGEEAAWPKIFAAGRSEWARPDEILKEWVD